ncbi:MAG: hypothetical protein LBJ60_06270 [Tannerellaceae bacterium]|jgi:hypothetical protein|nr:hypothetical protein [Tannerellaceae bacterium]
MAEYNLYDAPTTFILRFIREEKETHINEPVGVDGMVIALTRDKDYFGFSTEFIKSGTTLGFDVEAGRDEIKHEWEMCGADAEVEFRMEQNGIVLFKGLLKFATYSDDGATINIEIERTNFEELFRTRFDTPVDLQSVQSIDGVTLSGVSSKNITLHSKRIAKSAICDLEGVTDIEKQAEFADIAYKEYTQQLLTYNNRYDEFNEGVMKSSSWILDGNSINYHYNNFDYQFKTDEAGIYNIRLKCRLDLLVSDASRNSSIGSVRITLRMFADIPDNLGMQVGNRQILAQVEIFSGYAPDLTLELKDLQADYTVEASLVKEQRVYAFIEIAFPNSDSMFRAVATTLKSSLFSVTALTEAPASSC